jgi:hypothetical protein
MLHIKIQLYQACVDFIDTRLQSIQEVLKNATESAHSETKSTAGDKHETGRAMAQLEQEKSSFQWHEAMQVKEKLTFFNAETISNQVVLGSLIITNQGNFYISIGAGKIIIENQTFYAISTASPIAKKMLGLAKGASFEFNKQVFELNEIL